MQTKSDAQLLREYAAQRSETAFAEIVERHTDLVYSAACRQTGSPELAREIAQSVFTDLARKACTLAGTLPADASLVGWLYRGTRYAGLTLLRDERRRQAHERQVMEHFDPAPETAPDWARVSPVLDEAMAELGDADREAVLLRFFKKHDFQAVGRALGVSDDAAQKRVSRAVERLREFFAKRGITVGASELVVVITVNAVQAAPTGLAVTISTSVALAGTTIAATASATAIKTIAMTTLQKTLITGAIAAAAGTGIYEARQASALRTQVQNLQQQLAPSTQHLQQLTRERDDATRQLAALREDNERLNRNTTELLRLRGEVTRLRHEIVQPNGIVEPTVQTNAENIDAEAKSWIIRVNKLKQYLRDQPDKAFPESKLALNFQWLNATGMILESEQDFINARNVLRQSSLHQFGGKTLLALQKFSENNSDRFPSDLSELRTYFNPPIDVEILNRYRIVPATSIERLKNSIDADGWVITQKALADDNESPIAVGAHSYYFLSALPTE